MIVDPGPDEQSDQTARRSRSRRTFDGRHDAVTGGGLDGLLANERACLSSRRGTWLREAIRSSVQHIIVSVVPMDGERGVPEFRHEGLGLIIWKRQQHRLHRDLVRLGGRRDGDGETDGQRRHAAERGRL